MTAATPRELWVRVRRLDQARARSALAVIPWSGLLCIVARRSSSNVLILCAVGALAASLTLLARMSKRVGRVRLRCETGALWLGDERLLRHAVREWTRTNGTLRLYAAGAVWSLDCGSSVDEVAKLVHTFAGPDLPLCRRGSPSAVAASAIAAVVGVALFVVSVSAEIRWLLVIAVPLTIVALACVGALSQRVAVPRAVTARSWRER